MASRRALALATTCLKSHTLPQPRISLQLLSSTRRLAPTASRPHTPSLTTIRQKHTIPRPQSQLPPAPSSSSAPDETASASAPRSPQPQYELTFTCIPCSTRSKHKVSKQGYHHGSVLIACPSCKNRHVISDHLKIFGDRKITVEDLMRERGQLVKKGTLGEEGDIEFWDDGSVTTREQEVVKGEAAKEEGWKEEVPGTSFKNTAGGQAGS